MRYTRIINATYFKNPALIIAKSLKRAIADLIDVRALSNSSSSVIPRNRIGERNSSPGKNLCLYTASYSHPKERERESQSSRVIRKIFHKLSPCVTSSRPRQRSRFQESNKHQKASVGMKFHSRKFNLHARILRNSSNNAFKHQLMLGGGIKTRPGGGDCKKFKGRIIQLRCPMGCHVYLRIGRCLSRERYWTRMAPLNFSTICVSIRRGILTAIFTQRRLCFDLSTAIALSVCLFVKYTVSSRMYEYNMVYIRQRQSSSFLKNLRS